MLVVVVEVVVESFIVTVVVEMIVAITILSSVALKKLSCSFGLLPPGTTKRRATHLINISRVKLFRINHRNLVRWVLDKQTRASFSITHRLATKQNGTTVNYTINQHNHKKGFQTV